MRSYYMWDGVAAIEEDDVDGCDTDAEAIDVLLRTAAGSSRTWTLWRNDNGRAACVAVAGPGGWLVVIEQCAREEIMGARQLQDGGGKPRDPEEPYSVNLGDVHRALRGILNEYGLSRPVIDESIRAAVVERIDARIDHWLHQRDWEAKILERVTTLAIGTYGRTQSFADMIREVIRGEVKRMLADGLRADIEFVYPPRPSNDPYRKIQPVRPPEEDPAA